MSNPVIQAFFFGRALAEVLSEKVEDAFTNIVSELGKFDAEQREYLRQFTEEVQARAERVAANSQPNAPISTPSSSSPTDLQEMLDRLRAEIATLKAELNKYRQE